VEITKERQLNQTEVLELERLVLEEYFSHARKDYQLYVEYVHYPMFKVGKHIPVICKAVQELVEGRRFLSDGRKVRILILVTPPQHGKSTCVTETLPSWYLGNWPDRRVILVSYNEDLAVSFGRKSREKMLMYGKEIFDVGLLPKPQTDLGFVTDKGGGLISRGYMSGITGKPAEFILIDDPIKNKEEAYSESDREKKWNEYLSSIRTRLSAYGVVVLILTRWHEDDIAGRIIERESLPVEVLRFPCEAEEDDILGRKPGDALFPEIGKDNKWLDEFKQAYINDPSEGGIRAWNALYQGRPSAREGNMFHRHWWNYWVPAGWNPEEHKVRIQLPDGTYTSRTPIVLPKDMDSQLQSWDMTFKGGEGVDNVAGGVFGHIGARVFLLDSVYAPMSFVQTLSAVETLTKQYQRAFLKLIEKKANGEAVYDMLQLKIGGMVRVEPMGTKVDRAAACSPMVESGNVYLPHPKLMPWVQSFIDQCASFPNAAHDDYVDMLSQALLRLMYGVDPVERKESSILEQHKALKMRELTSARRRYRR